MKEQTLTSVAPRPARQSCSQRTVRPVSTMSSTTNTRWPLRFSSGALDMVMVPQDTLSAP